MYRALGLTPDDLADDLPIERGSSGVQFIYIPVRSQAALARVQPAADLYIAMGLSSPTDKTGAFTFTLDGAEALRASAETASLTVHGRMFAPFLGSREDPATGSAAGPLGGYLVRHGRTRPDAQGDDTARVTLWQGVEMGRASRLEVAIALAENSSPGERAISGVRVGGSSVIVAEGEVILP